MVRAKRPMNPVLLLLAVSLPAWADNYGNLPLSFEKNQGQTDARVQFLSRGHGHTLFLTSTEAVLASGHDVFRMKLAGANPASRAEGVEQQIARSNYFIGSDSTKWRTGIPNYGRVRFTEVYPGIDLVYYGKDRHLEYDWIVKPGADPSKIRLKFAGVKGMRVDRNGDLVLQTASGEIRQKKPIVYQEKEIAGRYVIRRGHEAGFEVGPYDAAKPLVIDPVLVYSSYLGGIAGDYGSAIAVDSAGHAYVMGVTGSTNFPTVPAQQDAGFSAFLTKVSADGKSLLFSTYLAGTDGGFTPTAFALDSAGNVFMTGTTASQYLPAVNAYQAHVTKAQGYSSSVWVMKLNPAGNTVLFSTYLSGSKDDTSYAIAVDTAGNPYVTGLAGSSDFPTVNPIQATPGGFGDTFISKFSADGSTLLYSTYLGGNGADIGRSIAVDISGNAYVTGSTVSTNFPTVNPFQSTQLQSSSSAFVAKINPSGSAFIYASYLGGLSGQGSNVGSAIAADSSGNAYVTGADNSGILPGQIGSAHGGIDAFVTTINATGSVVHSRFLGGSSTDKGFAITVNALGQPWVTGITYSSDFPTVNPLMAARPDFAEQIFVSQLSADLSTFLFSTYLSGATSSGDESHAIAVDSEGSAYVTGFTPSTDFPTVNPFQAASAGNQDAFVLKISNSAGGNGVSDFAGNGRSGALLYDPASGVAYTALSNGNGTFTYTGEGFTPGFNILRTGDFNGDRKADLVVYNSQTALAYIGMGNGDGTFAFQSLFWSPGYDIVEAGDLNGDGKTDFALYNSSIGTMYTGISNGAGGFTYKYTLISKSFTFVRLADFTGDGKADIFLYNAVNGSAFLGVGDGAGSFAFHGLFISAGYNLADVGDLNADGKADIILYNSTNGNAASGISDGAGGFTFTPMIFSPAFTSVRLADYTGDGKADVTVYNKTTGAAYFGTGTGTGTFNFQSLFWSPGYDLIIPEDVNGDGKADIILYNGTTGTEYTGISGGSGSFTYTYSLWGAGKILAR